MLSVGFHLVIVMGLNLGPYAGRCLLVMFKYVREEHTIALFLKLSHGERLNYVVCSFYCGVILLRFFSRAHHCKPTTSCVILLPFHDCKL